MPVAAHPLPRTGAALLGFALGGFFDGVLLHQILQWHHLLSLVPGVVGMAAQVLWDGVFHVVMYLLALVGLMLLWRGRGGLAAEGAGRRLVGWGAIGFGLWHVIDTLVVHWALGLHRIRVDAENPLAWDLAWLAFFGLGALGVGAALLARPGGGRGGRRAAAAMGIAALALGAGAAAPVGPPAEAALVVLRPGLGLPAATEAAAAVGGRVIAAHAGGRFWTVELPAGAEAGRMRPAGAILVARAPFALGCPPSS